jgi:Kef-type K+ transport system membrane component KefB
MELKDSLAVGFAMNARGAMEMILASVALEFGLIDQRIFVALVTMALVTSMMSGPLLQRLLKKPEETAVQST